MDKRRRKLLYGLIFMLCFLWGCNGKAKDGEQAGGNREEAGLSSYGEHISVKDIKEKYDYTDDGIMPLYNVAPDEEFDFSFPYDLSDRDTEDIVTVHTDENCQEESKVATYRSVEKTDKGSKVTVAPVAGVLLTEAEEEAYLEEDQGVWGNAPMYYIAIHYDMEADSPKKLEVPKIIPFTIKQGIKAPEAKGVVDSTGRFKLVWDEVEGATEYRIYKLVGEEQMTGEKNEPVNGAASGYDNCSLILDSVTDETEFDNFSGEGHGLAVHKDSLEDTEYVLGQNYCVNGEYYVSAVVDGEETGFCGAIPTTDLKIPHKLTDECDIMFSSYENVSDVPLVLDVINIDGSVTKRKVLYTYHDQVTWLGVTSPGYLYQIEGTALTGCVSMEDIDGDYPESIGELTPSGNTEPENKVKKKPDGDLPTIIQSEEDNTKEDNADDNAEDKPLVEQQKENTEQHVSKGNEEQVANPGDDSLIFADSAEEEWLALNLVNGETDISMEAFPNLQNPTELEDTFYKVYYQNPYILGLNRFSYDYGNLTFHVDYSYDKDEIKEKQKKMTEESQSVLAEITQDGMDEREKEKAVYDYLTMNCQYDTDALEDAQENNFQKTDDNPFEDSFNGYGILVNKKGVCQSYAYAYKLLCEMSGLSCKVMTGNLAGNLPHAWNAVKIGEEWFQTDATNNENTAGIPYFLYDADSAIAQLVGFEADKNFELDGNLARYQTENEQYEYYTMNNLVANSMEQYGEILDSQLSEDKNIVSIRFKQDNPDQQELVATVQQVYNKHGMEEKLSSLKCGISGRYIILQQE